jgi:4-amino-4-deoxy-L-arabinose transferase-like glycosyltransferase
LILSKRTTALDLPAAMLKLTHAIHQYPTRTFLAFLALHAVVWTVLPALFFINLPLDLIEGLVYGREWQLGYDKLPPLPWWMVEATHRLFGPDLFFYALSQLTVLAAFALIWVMARQLVGPVGALVAILIIDGMHYFTFTATKFNHDVIQLPFWALTGFAYWAALRGGRTVHWALLGFGIGMAVWAKYFIVVQAVPLALFGLFDRDARKSLATPGPWIAVAVALGVMSPHLVWLMQNDFLPFTYADARAAQFKGALDYLTKPSRFVLSQLGFLLPSLLIAAPYLRRDVRTLETAANTELQVSATAFDRRIVTLLAFGPAAMIVLLSIETGRDAVALWGYPLWLFLGLWIVLNARPLERVTLWRIVFLWGAIFISTAVVFAIDYSFSQRFRPRYSAVIYPGKQLGAEMSRRYRELTGQPLAYVIGAMWLSGNIAYYAPERPRALIDGNPLRAPWIDLDDLRSRGAVVVWVAGDPKVLPPIFRAVAGAAEIQPPLTLPLHLGVGVTQVGWALLRPQPVTGDGAAK